MKANQNSGNIFFDNNLFQGFGNNRKLSHNKLLWTLMAQVSLLPMPPLERRPRSLKGLARLDFQVVVKVRLTNFTPRSRFCPLQKLMLLKKADHE